MRDISRRQQHGSRIGKRGKGRWVPARREGKRSVSTASEHGDRSVEAASAQRSRTAADCECPPGVARALETGEREFGLETQGRLQLEPIAQEGDVIGIGMVRVEQGCRVDGFAGRGQKKSSPGPGSS